MNFCKNCGHMIEKDKKFCGKCGTQVFVEQNATNERSNRHASKDLGSKGSIWGIGSIIVIIFLIMFGLLFKDQIMFQYNVYKGDKESINGVKIAYYLDAYTLKNDSKVKEKIRTLLIEDNNFEETFDRNSKNLSEKMKNEMYKEVYIEKAKIAYKNEDLESSLNFVRNAEEYGFNPEKLSFYEELLSVNWDEESNEESSYESEDTETEESFEEYSLDFIFPYSDTEYLSDDDLDILSAEELAIARNEIFARRGYIFTKEVYQDFFSSKSWYTPDPNFKGSESELNEVERANLALIKQYEELF